MDLSGTHVAILYYVTGIPFSEKQAIKSRGQNYLDYQQKRQCLYRGNQK